MDVVDWLAFQIETRIDNENRDQFKKNFFTSVIYEFSYFPTMLEYLLDYAVNACLGQTLAYYESS